MADHPPGQPHGKFFYVIMAICSLIAGSGFGYGAYAAPTPILRMVQTLFALIFLAGAVESMHRLVHPDATRERSLSLSDVVRERLRFTRTVMVRFGWVIFFVGILLHLSSSDAVAGFGTDMEVYAGILWFAAWCIADYAGDRLKAFVRARRVTDT